MGSVTSVDLTFTSNNIIWFIAVSLGGGFEFNGYFAVYAS